MEPIIENSLTLFGNVDSLMTDGGPPYDSRHFSKFAKKMGFIHHVCTSKNPQANGFMKVFQKVLVKRVHTATVEGKGPKKAVQIYFAIYRITEHKTKQQAGVLLKRFLTGN